MTPTLRLRAVAAAAHRGDVLTLWELLSTGDVDVNAQVDGFTPLMFATAGGSAEAVTLLMRRGAAVNLCGADGSTPLMVAALWDHASIVHLLLEFGADPDIVDAEGWTALLIARARGHESIVDLIVAAGATR